MGGTAMEACAVPGETSVQIPFSCPPSLVMSVKGVMATSPVIAARLPCDRVQASVGCIPIMLTEAFVKAGAVASSVASTVTDPLTVGGSVIETAMPQLL